MFWRVDANLFNLEDLVKNIEKMHNIAIERHASSHDLGLIEQSLEHMYVCIRAPVSSFQLCSLCPGVEIVRRRLHTGV